MLPRPLQHSLLAAQVVGFATLLRSVAYDRWISVLGAALIVAGATAALRGRTWGLALSLASAAAFPVACLLGIAPFWFFGVGVVGALPFMLASDAMRRLDRQATHALAAIAATAGAAVALTWRLFAWTLFGNVPSLWPSYVPQHGLLVATLAVAGLGAFIVQGRRMRRARVRVEAVERVRVESATGAASDALAEAEVEVEEPRPTRTMGARVVPHGR